jgi:hypothetical protein
MFWFLLLKLFMISGMRLSAICVRGAQMNLEYLLVRAKRVVDSCMTAEQLGVAEKYCDLVAARVCDFNSVTSFNTRCSMKFWLLDRAHALGLL